MNNWKMLTLVGKDRPGIVARVTDALYQNGWNLGEASMLRLGGNFTIMLMISGAGEVEPTLQPVAQELGLRLHVDPIEGDLHSHVVPNIQVRVVGADRAGIVAQVTGQLAEAGLNILELESDVAGSVENPIYVMGIQGYAEVPVEDLQQAVGDLVDQGIDVTVSGIETLIG
ncbi:MAG: amino acid-binding protein [Gammaproteobacteria bacterium]|nr:amino acid-binding protein [Gammaproteobacteria bacterium]